MKILVRHQRRRFLAGPPKYFHRHSERKIQEKSTKNKSLRRIHPYFNFKYEFYMDRSFTIPKGAIPGRSRE